MNRLAIIIVILILEGLLQCLSGSYVLSKLRTAAERNDRRLSVLMLYIYIIVKYFDVMIIYRFGLIPYKPLLLFGRSSCSGGGGGLVITGWWGRGV